MITLTNTTIVEQQVIGVPQIRIWGSEGARSAYIILPCSKANWELLEALYLEIPPSEFSGFYENYTSDKYLIDLVFEKYSIVADTSSISDFE